MQGHAKVVNLLRVGKMDFGGKGREEVSQTRDKSGTGEVSNNSFNNSGYS